MMLVMTVFEASIKLYGWFSENDSFSMGSHYHKIMDAKSPNRDETSEAALTCALEDFEGMGIASRAKIKDQDVWILKRNFLTVDQDVKLSADTCLSIAELVNSFCDIVDNQEDKCNPAEINEKSIKSLIILCTYLMDQRGEDN